MALLQEGLSKSQRVLIAVELNGRTVYIPAEIRHCRALSGELVELGCRFQSRAEARVPAAATGPDPLAAVQEAVEALLASRQPEALPDDDRRAHRRVVFNDRIEIHPAAGGAPIVGFARDLSKGGIAFITTAQVPLEVLLVFLPRGQGVPLRIRAQVVRCNKIMDNLFDVGARFLELAGS
jgi:hypothetical protein